MTDDERAKWERQVADLAARCALLEQERDALRDTGKMLYDVLMRTYIFIEDEQVREARRVALASWAEVVGA